MKAPISIFRQIRTFRREQPDVVHLNSSILILTAISARLAGIQLVWHVREVLLGSRFNLRRRFAGWIIRTLAHRVICISEVEATRLGKDRKGTVNVIYNFIDFSQFFASDKEIDKVKKQFGLKDKPTYLSLGGVSFRKGTVEIILAAQQMPNAHFVIAGTASSSGTSSYKKTLLVAVLFQFEDLLIRWRLKSYYSWFYDQRVSVLCREKEVPNLHFVGRLNFVPPIIAASDAIIFAGRTPHFPRPVYEAWALQKPVVVFDMEGISSNIKDGADGVICKRNDAQGLIDGLGKISVEMGRKGQEKAATRFDMQTNIRKIIEVYGDLI